MSLLWEPRLLLPLETFLHGESVKRCLLEWKKRNQSAHDLSMRGVYMCLHCEVVTRAQLDNCVTKKKVKIIFMLIDSHFWQKRFVAIQISFYANLRTWLVFVRVCWWHITLNSTRWVAMGSNFLCVIGWLKLFISSLRQFEIHSANESGMRETKTRKKSLVRTCHMFFSYAELGGKKKLS